MVVKITNDNFEEEVLKSDKPVLLDFRTMTTSTGNTRQEPESRNTLSRL